MEGREKKAVVIFNQPPKKTQKQRKEEKLDASMEHHVRHMQKFQEVVQSITETKQLVMALPTDDGSTLNNNVAARANDFHGGMPQSVPTA